MRRVLRGIGYFVLGLLVASAIAELGFHTVEATPLRFVLPVSEIALYGPDSHTGYRHRAGARGMWLTENRADIAISSLGLRDRERSLVRTSGLRVVVVGDSLIEAVQVPLESTAVAIAEKRVAARKPGTEVINLGLAGAGPPVIAARLQSLGSELQPDLAIAVVNVSNFGAPILRDDSAFTGYRASPDGSAHLSYGFRNGRGYKIRTSAIGLALYWTLDHSALARVLNSRKNIGLFSEWPQHLPQAPRQDACTSSKTELTSLLSLWRDGEPKIASTVIDAFIRDLAKINASSKPAVIVMADGFPRPCSDSSESRNELVEIVKRRFAAQGLPSADLNMLMAGEYGTAETSGLRGFRSKIGRGHFNEQGNNVLGNVLAELILQWAPPGRR